MKYLLLIYSDENAVLSPEENKAVMDQYWAYTEALQKSGALVAGEGLSETKTATTVRVRNGKTVTTDGPFAETKEQLGGFYMIDVPGEREALEWAAKIPTSVRGSIEVRPVMSYE